jgi:hypothetical protein
MQLEPARPNGGNRCRSAHVRTRQIMYAPGTRTAPVVACRPAACRHSSGVARRGRSVTNAVDPLGVPQPQACPESGRWTPVGPRRAGAAGHAQQTGATAAGPQGARRRKTPAWATTRDTGRRAPHSQRCRGVVLGRRQARRDTSPPMRRDVWLTGSRGGFGVRATRGGGGSEAERSLAGASAVPTANPSNPAVDLLDIHKDTIRAAVAAAVPSSKRRPSPPDPRSARSTS